MSQPFYAGSTITAEGLDNLAVQFAVSAGQTIESTTPVAISGFSFPVGVGTYIARAHLVLDCSAGGTGEFRWTGPDTSLTLLTLNCHQDDTLDAYPYSTASNGNGYNGTGFISSQEFAGAFYLCDLELTVTLTAAGTLALEAANEAGDTDTWDVYAGSTLSLILQQT